MTVAAIVQARIGSTRLPGKILQELGGKPVLAHVLNRCRAIPSVATVVCAVPDEAASAPVEKIARECGVRVARGPEKDVLDRYLRAGREAGADVVLRVTSDCPLIDPAICDAVLTLRHRESADYAANNMPASFPHGLDCEAFTLAALAEAGEKATAAEDREHVTPWLRRAPHLRRVNLANETGDQTGYRWTLDYPEDLAFFRALFAAMPEAENSPASAIVDFLTRRPEISAINASRRDLRPAEAGVSVRPR